MQLLESSSAEILLSSGQLMETDGSLFLRNPAGQVTPGTHGQGGELTPAATKLPRPGGSRGEQTVESFFLRASKFWERLGSWELQTSMSHARCQRSQPPAAPRLDAALPLPLNACSPVPSSALWNNRFVRDGQHHLCPYWRRPSVVVAGCRQKTRAESPERTDREKESKRGPPGRTFHSAESQVPNLSCSFSVALESLTGSTNRGQRPRMAGLKWTMLDLETGGMCANAAVRWRSQACVAACPWPYRSATSKTGEMSFSLASIQVPKPNGHS